MALKIGLQIDPPHTLKPATDSSLLLGREAYGRGHEVWYFSPADVSATGENIVAHAAPITFPDDAPFALGQAQRLDLQSLDIILMRQDPPFDMRYITNTFLLERLIEGGTLVLNHPISVRNGAEKLLPLHFPDYIPPTLVTSSEAEIRTFQREHGEIVLKPLYAFGGRGIVRISRDDDAAPHALALAESSGAPVLAQKFLPEVMTDEKRIILIDGNIIGAFHRIPPAGDFRANTALGGSYAQTTLTTRQQEIAEDIGYMARMQGFLLVGLDVIGDWLGEINVTCPTGLMILKELYEMQPEKDFWDVAEELVTLRQSETTASF